MLVEVVVAVELNALRQAIIGRLVKAGLPYRQSSPREVSSLAAEGPFLIVLETGADTERLIRTAEETFEAWNGSGEIRALIRTYSPATAISDDVIRRLWAIGFEMAVTVGRYEPIPFRDCALEVASWASYLSAKWQPRRWK